MKLTVVIIFICISQITGYACTSFFINRGGNSFYGNNEDWLDLEYKIWFIPAENGKLGKVCFGHKDNGWVQGGVNEKGVCWDFLLGEDRDDWYYDDSKTDYNGNLCDKIFSECSTIDEVIDYFEKYNYAELIRVSMLFCDGRGNSAMIGWKDSALWVNRKTDEYQIMGYGAGKIRNQIKDDTVVNINSLSSALKEGRQEGTYPTRYSYLVDLNKKIVYIFYQSNFLEYVPFDIKVELDKESHEYYFNNLFSSITIDTVLLERQDNTCSAVIKWKGLNSSNYSLYCSTTENMNETKPVYIINTLNVQKSGIEILFITLITGLSLYFKKRNILFAVLAILFVTNNSCEKQTTETKPEITEYRHTIKDLELNKVYFWKIKAQKDETIHSETLVQSFIIKI